MELLIMDCAVALEMNLSVPALKGANRNSATAKANGQ